MGSYIGSYTIVFNFHNHSVHLAKSRGFCLCHGLSSQHIPSVTTAGRNGWHLVYRASVMIEFILSVFPVVSSKGFPNGRKQE